MLEVLTNPNAFFGRKSHEEIDWKIPIAIIALVIIVKIISSFIVTIGAIGLFEEIAKDGFGDLASGMMIISFVVGVFFTIIGTLLWWLLYSTLFHIVSSRFNAVGDFPRVMAFVSYGFLPNIFKAIVSVFYGNKLISTIGNVNNTAITKEVIVSDPSMKIAALLMIIFTLWSGYIWMYGLSYSRNISVKNAAIPVAIPVLISILYTVYQYRHIIIW